MIYQCNICLGAGMIIVKTKESDDYEHDIAYSCNCNIGKKYKHTACIDTLGNMFVASLKNENTKKYGLIQTKEGFERTAKKPKDISKYIQLIRLGEEVKDAPPF